MGLDTTPSVRDASPRSPFWTVPIFLILFKVASYYNTILNISVAFSITNYFHFDTHVWGEAVAYGLKYLIRRRVESQAKLMSLRQRKELHCMIPYKRLKAVVLRQKPPQFWYNFTNQKTGPAELSVRELRRDRVTLVSKKGLRPSKEPSTLRIYFASSREVPIYSLRLVKRR